jgi:hypothetical protein
VNRIAVIGAGGAGKTRLARTLGRVLDLPVVHLDAHYYNPDWQPLPPAEWAARQHQLAAGTRWVMTATTPAPWPCVWSTPTRSSCWTCTRCCAPGKSCGGGRLATSGPSDLPAGLRPKLGRQFLTYVLGFRRYRRPALLAELARWSHDRTVVILRSRRAVKQFIARLPSA